MNHNSEYTLTWSFLGATRISSNTEKNPIRVKKIYYELCSLIGCLGWIPAILFESVWPIGIVPLRILVSAAIFLFIYYAVLYGFHLFLCAMNRRGKLSKYIEISCES